MAEWPGEEFYCNQDQRDVHIWASETRPEGPGERYLIGGCHRQHLATPAGELKASLDLLGPPPPNHVQQAPHCHQKVLTNSDLYTFLGIMVRDIPPGYHGVLVGPATLLNAPGLLANMPCESFCDFIGSAIQQASDGTPIVLPSNDTQLASGHYVFFLRPTSSPTQLVKNLPLLNSSNLTSRTIRMRPDTNTARASKCRESTLHANVRKRDSPCRASSARVPTRIGPPEYKGFEVAHVFPLGQMDAELASCA
ncbi:hypothetical protein C8F01DRAFT_27912 [Mycena amicta]|nr:hypothetical protein C8F01DRAFT_27912 [Mycena amicta]